MNLEDRAKEFGESNRVQGGSGWKLMADFAQEVASEAVKAREIEIADGIEKRLRKWSKYPLEATLELQHYVKLLRGTK